MRASIESLRIHTYIYNDGGKNKTLVVMKNGLQYYLEHKNIVNNII